MTCPSTLPRYSSEVVKSPQSDSLPSSETIWPKFNFLLFLYRQNFIDALPSPPNHQTITVSPLLFRFQYHSLGLFLSSPQSPTPFHCRPSSFLTFPQFFCRPSSSTTTPPFYCSFLEHHIATTLLLSSSLHQFYSPSSSSTRAPHFYRFPSFSSTVPRFFCHPFSSTITFRLLPFHLNHRHHHHLSLERWTIVCAV